MSFHLGKKTFETFNQQEFLGIKGLQLDNIPSQLFNGTSNHFSIGQIIFQRLFLLVTLAFQIMTHSLLIIHSCSLEKCITFLITIFFYLFLSFCSLLWGSYFSFFLRLRSQFFHFGCRRNYSTGYTFQIHLYHAMDANCFSLHNNQLLAGKTDHH